ncbi:MAG: rod shape-determining protein [Lachnospiraceae bacterium]|nr:rod shape-determining protein [Lachnospiraceae bacterium]
MFFGNKKNTSNGSDYTVNGHAFGIDLGTGNIKIFNNADGSIINEKNMIAVKGKDDLLAYGNEAYDMFEKNPSNIRISYPLSNGVIADINHMQVVLKSFISEMTRAKNPGSDFFVAVPTDITEVEKRAFFDLVKDSNVKAKKIMIVEKAIADGLGLDIDVKNSQGVMIVDVGFDTTEISILSLGGIVISKLIKVGGRKFDECIQNAIRREYHLVIGGKTSEKLKIELNTIRDSGEDAVVYGRDIVTGLPVERRIPTDLVDISLNEHVNTIVDNVKVILERTPPELAADIYKHGIYLTGGSANLVNIQELVSRGTSLNVNLSEEPQVSVVEGLARVIKEESFRSVAYSIEGMSQH